MSIDERLELVNVGLQFVFVNRLIFSLTTNDDPPLTEIGCDE